MRPQTSSGLFIVTAIGYFLPHLVSAQCPVNSILTNNAKFSKDTINVFDNGNWVTSLAQAMHNTGYILVGQQSTEVELQNSGFNAAGTGNPKLTLVGSGLSLAGCGDVTWYLSLLLVENMRQGVPRESLTSSPGVDCPCLGKNCNAIPPFRNNTIFACKNTPCGCINPQCTCDPGAFEGYYWRVPTSAVISYNVPSYTGPQINLGYRLSVPRNCGFGGSSTFSGLLNIGSDILSAGGISNDIYNRVRSGVNAANGFFNFLGLGCGQTASSGLTDASNTTKIFDKNISPNLVSTPNAKFAMPAGCQLDPYGGPHSPNFKTNYVNTISYIDSHFPDKNKPLDSCFCQDDGTNTVCVATHQSYIGATTEWYKDAISNATVASILEDHCWGCETGPLTLSFKNEFFSVSIFPTTSASSSHIKARQSKLVMI
ncbi:hypothetical protein HDU76_007529 [Blyttiomyces sp. JEL0837]|nr:hypothetical protein HDU76_007529 [Blyttiomyces sp. JEL0837]